MNINEKNLDNEIFSAVTESSKLTNQKIKTSTKSNANNNSNKNKTNILYIIIIFLILMIIILYIISKKNKSNINIFKFKDKKTDVNLYSDKWIVMSTDKPPNSYFAKILSLTKNNTKKILVIEKGEDNQEKLWQKYLNKKNATNKLIYLSLEDQNKLGYKTVDYIPKNSYARKNIGYLYAIEHGAKEVLDTDDNILLDNSLLSVNLTISRIV